MKKLLTTLLVASLAITGFAKDIQTVVVTTTPVMHCSSCEKKIKENIRFEKGVKAIATDIPNQTVTIRFDAHKTTVENILKGFPKFGYKAEVVKISDKTEDKKK